MHREVALIQIKKPEKFFLRRKPDLRPCPLLRHYSGQADINSRRLRVLRNCDEPPLFEPSKARRQLPQIVSVVASW
jgi:hypothetical protein